MRSIFRAAALALGLLVGSVAMAQNLKPINLIVFPGGFNWPVWVA